jgi:CPA1 family monovalent cation:H+ antiporter
MELFRILAILITLAALFSYVNHRYVRAPMAIGIMLIALLLSLALLAIHRFGIHLDVSARAMLGAIDFNQAVLQGMLAFLLFAGALHVELNDLRDQQGVIALLATVGVVVSTAVVGFLMWSSLWLVGLRIPLLYALVFGALISPTDPIAVLGIMRSAGVPKALEHNITGEALFNDGVGVVLFLVLLDLATGAHGAEPGEVAVLLVREAVGGVGLGVGAGLLAYWMLRSVDHYQVEVLLTLALVMGTYALAGVLELSGPIAIVVAGLLIGNQGRAFAMSEQTRERLDTFWELVDEILNAVLFVLIGLEILVLTLSHHLLLAGLLAIPIVLFARWLSVSGAVWALHRFRSFSPRTIYILTWGGLRGGISVALALSLPAGPAREVIVAVTYAVVVFSILVQGLTLGWLIRSGPVEIEAG